MTVVLRDGDQVTTTAELAHGALAGDREAWEGLVRRYNGALYKVALSYHLDQATADDAVQTAWLRLIEHLDTLHEADAVGAWLMTTLRRHIGSVIRSGRREPRLVGFDCADVPDPGRSPEEQVAAGDMAARTQSALHRLPVRARRLLTLLMDSPRPSYGQVAAELSMPVGSVGPTRARSLDLLRRELEAAGIDDEALCA